MAEFKPRDFTWKSYYDYLINRESDRAGYAIVDSTKVGLDTIGITDESDYHEIWQKADEILQMITDYVSNHIGDVARGDVIKVDDINLVVYWNGRKAIISDNYESDDEPEVPREFLVPTEFGTHYFVNEASYVWFDAPRFADQIRKTLTNGNLFGQKRWFAKFEYNNHVYTLVMDDNLIREATIPQNQMSILKDQLLRDLDLSQPIRVTPLMAKDNPLFATLGDQLQRAIWYNIQVPKYGSKKYKVEMH